MNRMTKMMIAFASIAMMTTTILGINQKASAWQPASLSIDAIGCTSAEVTATNPEGQIATVRGGNLWAVGTTISVHGSIKKVVGSGDYSVTVNYPSDHTMRTSTIKVRLPNCPTTTTTTTTTTIVTPSTEPVSSPPSTQAVPSMPAEPIEYIPSFTG